MSHLPTNGRAVVEEMDRRYRAGEPLEDLFAPDYRSSVNSPAALIGLRVQGGPAEHVAAMQAEGIHVETRSISDGADGRFLIENVWIHQAGASGSSGRFWTVATVRDGLLVAEEHLEHETEARRRAGL